MKNQPIFMNLQRTLFFKSIFSSTASHSRHLSRNITLQNLLKRGFSPTLSSLNSLLAFLSSYRRFQLVLSIFDQMVTHNFIPNTRTHSIVCWVLAKQGKFEEAEDFLTQIEQNGGFPNVGGIYNYLIQGYCRAGDPEKALNLLQRRTMIDDIGISPLNSFSFYSLIHCFSVQGKMDRAIRVFCKMENAKFPVDNYICSTILAGYCNIGKPELALGFYEKNTEMGICPPNIVTYTAVVTALCRNGRIEKVNELVHKMEQEGIVADAVFYSSWICGYCNVGILTEAFSKHKSMVEAGIRPDIVSYTILIDGFCKQGDVEKAVGFLNEMHKHGVQPNLVTCTAIMWGFCKVGKLDEAFGVFAKLEELGLIPDEFTYATLIDGLCRKGILDRAFHLLDEMEKNGVPVTLVTYNTVINGLCKIGKTHEADEIAKGIVGDNFTFGTILHGYCEEENVAGVLETKRRLEEVGVCMDLITCNILIRALCMAGRFEDADELFKRMPELGLVADSVSYCTMIDGYCKLGKIDEALEIFDVYRRSSLVTGIAVYNCVIGALCREGRVVTAMELCNELIEMGLVPDAIIYMKLIKEHCREGNGGDEVLEILRGVDKLEPGVQSLIFNKAIGWLCKKKSCSEAVFDLFLIMKRKGLGVTIKSYYLVIKGLIRNGNHQSVRLVLNYYLKEHGFFDSRIHTILVLYFCNKDTEQALWFLDLMRDKGLSISVSTAILNALIKEGRAEIGCALAMEAEENGIVLDVVAYSILIDGLCKQGSLHEALELCFRMRKKGISPNIVTYNSVINGLCQQGCLIEAFRLFDSLERNDVVPTVITYSTLIGALSREGFVREAHQLFENMVQKGLAANTFVYNLLINGYCRFGILEEASKLLLDMGRSFIEPNEFTVTAVINCCCQKGNMEGALEFFSEFKRQGISPDFLGYVNLIKGLSAKGRMEEARGVLREMLEDRAVRNMIARANQEIDVGSFADILGFLCEDGRIEEATNILREVGPMVSSFEVANSNCAPTKLNQIYRRNMLRGDKSDLGRGYIHKSVKKLPGKPCEEREGVDRKNYDPSMMIKCPLPDFDTYYSIIALHFSKGEQMKGHNVVKEMLANFEEHR